MQAASPISYRISWEPSLRYTYIVEIVLTPSKGKYTDIALPAWRPGRYVLQNYAAAVSHFSAWDAKGVPLSWRKVTKDTWRIQNPAKGSLRISYRFYARQLDAGSSYINEELVYINPINLLMYAVGRLEEACELVLPKLPLNWKVATALPQIAHGHFRARDYHELVDCPLVAAPVLRQETITCDGVKLYVHFWGEVGAKSLTGFLSDLCRIVQVQKRIWGGKLPLKEYHFIYLLVPFSIRHAVEHENCAMFVLPQEGANSEESLKSFLGISAHEFFHVWNVKRLRPAALWPYRYDKEYYTSLHWLTEGVTDYYTSLTLLRAGILSVEEFWRRLSLELSQIENSFAYRLFSPAELSIDSWLSTSIYRPPHFQGSFYAAGKRVGFLLDMVLRRETKGKVCLDSLLQYLYELYYERGRGIPEDGVEKAAIQLGGPFLKKFFADYVWGREAPPYEELLAGLPLEVRCEQKPFPDWGKLGLVRLRSEGEGLRVEELVPGSLAEKVGIEVGDILLTLNEQNVKQIDSTFWSSLVAGQEFILGWNRQGFPMEGHVYFSSQDEVFRTEIYLFPTDRRFLLEY
ncbi:MAG: PDZ domain-containing protein [Bacteroidia bacterium]|nr:PDZ domain-containing protein [Bacteroidia bacterium]MDW8133779.1 PDZ domain-containing protein [Bacteroidia bacterium]